MRSKATVGLPIDLVVYPAGSLRISRYRRLEAEDPELKAMRAQWDEAVRRAVHELPGISFDVPGRPRSL